MATETKTPTKVVTGKVRFSYAHVFRPQAPAEGAEPKYSVSLIIAKSDKDALRKIKAAVDAAKELGKAKFGGKIPPNLKTPLRDGDVDRPDDEAYENSYFMNATSTQKPGVVDAACQEILDQSEFYSGCYGRASVNFFAYNTAGNKGIACGLNNVQKLADGDSLTGRSRAEDDFGDESEYAGSGPDSEEEDFLS